VPFHRAKLSKVLAMSHIKRATIQRPAIQCAAARRNDQTRNDPASSDPMRSCATQRSSVQRSSQWPAVRDPTALAFARVPSISGQKPLFFNQNSRYDARGPPFAGAGARAMFLSNIYIYFDMAYNYPIKRHIVP